MVCLLNHDANRPKTDPNAETFWIDLLIQNPLDSEVSLSNLSVAVKSSDSSPLNDVDVETIAEITLAASETRIVHFFFF